jgi:hypothetical protein
MRSRIRTFKINCSYNVEKTSTFSGYKLLLLHIIRPGNSRKCYDVAMDIINKTDKDEQFLHRAMFSDEVTFIFRDMSIGTT